MVCAATCASAQDVSPRNDRTRTQYPPFMLNSYFTFNLGSIRYIFSGDQLAPGFQAESIDIPHLAARVDLFGHHFTKHLSAQVTYMRPARYVVYHNINGDGASHQISTAYGGLTLVWESPLSTRISAYGEGGWGVTSRSGFDIDGKTALQAAHFTAGLLGAGLAYHATPNIDFMFGATYSPSRKSFAQPSTRLFTTGLRYHMRPLPADEVEDNRHGFTFPLNVDPARVHDQPARATASTTSSRRPCRFSGAGTWKRGAASRSTTSATCSTRRRCSPSISARARRTGRATAIGKSSARSPCIRSSGSFSLRTEPADVYFSYSLAGPTFLSRTVIDGLETGERFTFQDFMSVGGFFGKTRRMNAEIGVKHYSNGNIFTKNAGIKIPLTLTLGLTF